MAAHAELARVYRGGSPSEVGTAFVDSDKHFFFKTLVDLIPG